MCQAWALACAIRNLLGKNPTMWMQDFPHDVWELHRKLHHRYLKFHKCFDDATAALPSFMAAAADPKQTEPKLKKTTKAKSKAPAATEEQVICLMSDSSTDEDDGDGTDTE